MVKTILIKQNNVFRTTKVSTENIIVNKIKSAIDSNMIDSLVSFIDICIYFIR